MKKLLFIIFFLISSWLYTVSAKARLQDPIQDYLQMSVPDRHEFLDAYTTIYRATCDLNGDGTNVVFVGTVYTLSGVKTIYWAAYLPATGGSGFSRITPATQDIAINLSAAFVGLCQEKSKQGIIELGNSLFYNGHEVVGYQKVCLYSISNGQLVSDSFPALDLTNSADKAFYNKYFGAQSVSRKVKIETFSTSQLQQKGYTIPTWNPPPAP